MMFLYYAQAQVSAILAKKMCNHRYGSYCCLRLETRIKFSDSRISFYDNGRKVPQASKIKQ